MEGNVIGRPSFCGAAKISLGDLAPEAPSSHIGTYTGRVPGRIFRRSKSLSGNLCIFVLKSTNWGSIFLDGLNLCWEQC